MGDVKVMGEHNACSAGKSGAQGIGGNFVFTNSQAGTAVGRVLKVHDKKQDDDHNPENVGEAGQTGNTHETGSAAHIIDVQDTDTDYFAQTQGSNGQIVTV